MTEYNNHNPIGIFDSGIGGLTVAHSISEHLPQEQLIYFGDTAHMPYGDKSKDLIKRYSLQISEFLIEEKKCKAIVIACNTASAAAYEYLRDKHKGSIPIINVIDPIIEAVVSDDSIKRVGAIATKTTIGSGVYQEKMKRRKPSLAFHALATPLLAHMIEEGFYNDNISETVIYNYLQDKSLNGIDALILGCTHYVLIKNQINKFYQNNVKLFDSTAIVAKKLKDILEKEGLLAGISSKKEKNVFYISDFTPSFEQTAKQFYGEEIHLKPLSLSK